ncbi:hypothetical protein VUR80DRAFT_6016 [Thermomyces stellatus]
MAFQQPSRQALQRTLQTASPRERESLDSQSPGHLQQSPIPNETQNWVLFSPNDNATSSSYLVGSDESLRTAGRSKASDFGSLDTNTRSDGDVVSQPISPVSPDGADQSVLEEDAELDSLDGHLPDFRVVQSPCIDSPSHAPSAPVLPRHDGLGSFRVDEPAHDAGMQERLYAFERFNPNRVTRNNEADASDHAHDSEETRRMQRIESWSLEQSRLVLEHIQKETRARRHSQSSPATKSQLSSKSEENVVMAKSDDKPSTIVPGEHDHLDWHDGSTQDSSSEPRGVLSRTAWTFLKDVIGIDERLISILLGRSSVDEVQQSQADSRLDPLAEDTHWETSILERVAKELGTLLNRVSHHPGAFSTYARMQRMPLPYAGLPVIPETTMAPPAAQVPDHSDGLSATIPEFLPTMAQSTPVTAGQDPRQYARRDSGSSSGSSDVTFTQEEWEKDLDIKLVFRYLRSRFGSRPSPPASAGTSHLATSSTQDIAAKAARVRAHHPLVGARPRAVERRSFRVTAPGSPVLLRHTSSCASQSTRRSGKKSSCSSRHYWDIGGSLGTGSVIASTGPMGSWGEV